MLFGRHVGWSPVTTPLGNKLNALHLEVSLHKEDVAVTFQNMMTVHSSIHICLMVYERLVEVPVFIEGE